MFSFTLTDLLSVSVCQQSHLSEALDPVKTRNTFDEDHVRERKKHAIRSGSQTQTKEPEDS